MQQERKRLGDAELEVMQAAWRAGEEVTSAYILQQLKGKRTWGQATLLTVLGRLADKGFLVCDKRGRHNFYLPAITEEDYRQSEGRTVLEKLYGNSVTGLVASLVDGKSVSEEDLRELRRFLEEY
ncbi:MAG: BlaI/MecI/CopY family transcriptional regulator [Oscillibacter sp.]